MARLPSAPTVEAETLPPAFAEEWFGVEDVGDALRQGLRAAELVDYLSRLAGEHYRTADQGRPRNPLAPIPRDSVVSIRPEVITGNPEVDAHRHWLLSGRCPFRDEAEFLSAVASMA